jgi:hypothetical protein
MWTCYECASAQEDYNGEILGIEVDFSLPARRVIRCLERVTEIYGKPDNIGVITDLNLLAVL